MQTRQNLPPIQNESVCLRLLSEADLPLTLAWRNQPEIRRWFFYSAELTLEQHRTWFEKYLLRNDDYVFIIEEVHSNQPIGQVALYNIDWESRHAEFGRLMLGEDAARGRGYAKSATRLVCRLGFETLGLTEIYLEVYENNAVARAVYRACGFQLESLQDGVAVMKLRREDLGV